MVLCVIAMVVIGWDDINDIIHVMGERKRFGFIHSLFNAINLA